MIELSDIQRQVVLAMLGQAGLTMLLLLLLPVPRIAAIRAKQVKLDQHGRPVFPKWPTQVADCFNNQFQTPVLFYLLCGLALWLRVETQLFAWLALGYVVLRVGHAAVFITSNVVPVRFLIFMASVVVLLAMLLQVAWPVLGF